MTATAPPSIASPPTAPSRASQSTFAVRSDAWLAWMATFVGQLIAAIANVYANAVDAYNSATSAASSATSATTSQGAAASSAAAAANSAGAALWVSGGNYAVGDVRRSPANQYAYRCIATAAGRTTDPSLDTSYWALAAASLPPQIIVSGAAQTASANGHYALTNAAATTLTLPASPVDGDPVWVTPANGRSDNIVARNGKTIMGLAQDLIHDQRYTTIRLRYVASTGDWRL